MDIVDFLIDEEKTMIEAMEQLDKVAKKVLFVLKKGMFVASITDGDIRRWILKKGNLDAKIKQIANYNPKYLYEDKSNKSKEFMREFSIEALPIVDENKNIVSVILWNDIRVEAEKKMDIPVVIMAGGLGTRLFPYTKILPKPLIPIGELPIAEHIINRFCKNGIRDYYLIINHKKNMIKAYFNEIEKDYKIDYVDESEPLGTGGGLSLLKGTLKSTFILSNCDILIDEDYSKILKYHKKEENLITMVCSLKKIKIPYGVIELNETGQIIEMKEKPELSFFTNTGMYIVEPSVVEEMEEKKFLNFTDVIESYKNKGSKIGVYPISESAWMDMGQIDEMEEMRRRLERNE